MRQCDHPEKVQFAREWVRDAVGDRDEKSPSAETEFPFTISLVGEDTERWPCHDVDRGRRPRGPHERSDLPAQVDVLTAVLEELLERPPEAAPP